jgi:bacterioferritin
MGAVHPRVLGFLGRALSLELSAVQQYMTHASLVELWGDAEAAELFRHETVEEMQHAEKIVQRMLAVGVAPAASQLRAVTHGPDLVGLLRHNAQLEDDLISHYTEALRFCVLIGDVTNEMFFRDLLNDEQHHAAELSTWLQSLGGQVSRHQERATF